MWTTMMSFRIVTPALASDKGAKLNGASGSFGCRSHSGSSQTLLKDSGLESTVHFIFKLCRPSFFCCFSLFCSKSVDETKQNAAAAGTQVTSEHSHPAVARHAANFQGNSLKSTKSGVVVPVRWLQQLVQRSSPIVTTNKLLPEFVWGDSLSLAELHWRFPEWDWDARTCPVGIKLRFAHLLKVSIFYQLDEVGLLLRAVLSGKQCSSMFCSEKVTFWIERYS